MKPKYDALEALEGKATPGPWAAPEKPGVMTTMITDASGKNVADVGFRLTSDIDMHNARLITAARNAVPDLIADVRALAEALTRLVDEYPATAFATWGIFVHEDHPQWLAARAALARIQGEAG